MSCNNGTQAASPPTPKILPPYKIEPPAYTPGMSVSVQPMSSKHAYWLDDYEYYDQLGRDPLQERRIWGITDADERVEALKALLSEFPKQMHRRKMLIKAVRREDEGMVRCLVDAGTQVHFEHEEDGSLTVSKKEDGDKEEEDERVDETDLPDKPDSSIDPVHVAAVNGHLGCLKILLESGVQVDIRDEFGRTPFLAAASSGKIETMKYLLEQGADPIARVRGNDLSKQYMEEYDGANALEFISNRGNVEMAKLLLEKPGVEVTPLAIKAAASTPNGYEVLKLLLDHAGYLPDGSEGVKNAEKPSVEIVQAVMDATSFAVSGGDWKSLKLILSYNYPAIQNDDIASFVVPEYLHKPFIWGAYSAVQRNQPDSFEFIHSLGLTEHDSMSLDDLPEGQTINIQHLLDTAAAAGSIDCARLLIEKYGADPNAFRFPSGILPLYEAACHDQPEMVRFLLEEHNVDVHLGSGRFAAGPTALWTAVMLKSLESVSLLLQHGGPVDYIDEEIRIGKEAVECVLIAKRDGRISFETTENAKDYIESAKGDWSTPNSYYVRLVVGPQDKEWVDTVQLRRSDEKLREEGDGARELNEEEAVKVADLEPEDPRRMMVDLPTNVERAKKLAEDDDLMPRFKAAFKLA